MELACAYADNAMSLEQTILDAYQRGHAMFTAKFPVGLMKTIEDLISMIRLHNNKSYLLPYTIEQLQKQLDTIRHLAGHRTVESTSFITEIRTIIREQQMIKLFIKVR